MNQTTNDPAAALAWLQEHKDNRAEDEQGGKWRIVDYQLVCKRDGVSEIMSEEAFITWSRFTLYRHESKKQLREQLAIVTAERDALALQVASLLAERNSFGPYNREKKP